MFHIYSLTFCFSFCISFPQQKDLVTERMWAPKRAAFPTALSSPEVSYFAFSVVGFLITFQTEI